MRRYLLAGLGITGLGISGFAQAPPPPLQPPAVMDAAPPAVTPADVLRRAHGPGLEVAPTPPEFMTVDTWIKRIAQIRAQKAKLDVAERTAIAELKKAVAEQNDKLKQLGITDENPTTSR